jgi:uncharacterized protein (TIGR01244 family)
VRLIAITPTFSAADQIDEQDVQTLAVAGFGTVVGNRPDTEGGVPMARIGAACARNGLKFFSQPVEFSAIGLGDADEFGRILQQSDQPVLAYCRSGRRSTALWALACAPLAGAQAVLEACARAGVNLDELRALLERSAARVDPPYASSADPAARERFIERWIKDIRGAAQRS